MSLLDTNYDKIKIIIMSFPLAIVFFSELLVSYLFLFHTLLASLNFTTCKRFIKNKISKLFIFYE
jgi:hypothetical protein